MGRLCASCFRYLPQSSYTANQFSNWFVSRCVSCVHRHPYNTAPSKYLGSGRYNVSDEANFTSDDLANPFAQGAFRWVAMGTYIKGPRSGRACVGKWFKTGAAFSNDYFTLDIKAIDKALEIVNIFNQLNIITTSKVVRINVPAIWDFVGGDEKWAGQKILCEPFIENYQKFNSNSGWNDTSRGWGEVMQALSHFSYHISGGNYLLCDLQGGFYQDYVVLSDPVILSQNREYGVTDLGPAGISSFFSQHVCNSHCRRNWVRPARPVQYFPAVPGTTMIQLSVPTRSAPAKAQHLLELPAQPSLTSPSSIQQQASAAAAAASVVVPVAQPPQMVGNEQSAGVPEDPVPSEQDILVDKPVPRKVHVPIVVNLT
ncbi:hypothetical protein FQN50_004437 [Emmonsiellopsis sp. PD_5]|nr:hypothetical protein FQN50_004437 [Emmonsiellopsis sp. PD_5]